MTAPQLLASPAGERPAVYVDQPRVCAALANVALLNRVPVVHRDPYEIPALLNNWLQAIGNGGAPGPDGKWIEYSPPMSCARPPESWRRWKPWSGDMSGRNGTC